MLDEVRKAFETKRAQLVTYAESIDANDDSLVSHHAAAVAEGRLLQLHQDIALLTRTMSFPKNTTEAAR